jgi:hypothetical protein
MQLTRAQQKVFEEIVESNTNVWLWGPPATGKSVVMAKARHLLQDRSIEWIFDAQYGQISIGPGRTIIQSQEPPPESMRSQVTVLELSEQFRAVDMRRNQ